VRVARREARFYSTNLIIVKQNMQEMADCFAAAASGYFSPHLFWEKVLKHNGKKYTPTSTG